MNIYIILCIYLVNFYPNNSLQFVYIFIIKTLGRSHSSIFFSLFDLFLPFDKYNKFLLILKRTLRHCPNVDGRIFLLLPISQLLVPRQALYRYRRSAVDNRE